MDLLSQIRSLIAESPKAPPKAPPKSQPKPSLEIIPHWTNESLTFISLRQVCACGAEHTSAQGLFLRQRSRHASRTIRTGWDHEDFRNLPRSTEELLETIPVCHECFAVDQILAIFSNPSQPLQLFLEV